MATTGSDPETDPERVLHIRFRRNSSDRIEETLRAIDAGAEADPYFEVRYFLNESRECCLSATKQSLSV